MEHFSFKQSNEAGVTAELLPMENRRIVLYAITFLADVVILLGSLRLVTELAQDTLGLRANFRVMQTTVPIFVAVAVYNRVYSIRGLESLKYAVSKLLTAMGLSLVVYFSLAYYLSPDGEQMLDVLAAAIALSVTGMTLVRTGVFLYVKTQLRGSAYNVLVIEDGGPPVPVDHAKRITVSPTLASDAAKDPSRLDALGRRMRHADRVIVSCPASKRLAWAKITRASGVQGEILSENLNKLGVLDVVRQNNTAFLVVSSGPLGLRSRVLKRIIDLTFTVLALVALSPIMLLVAFAIKLEDRGPVFFVQPRIGHGNRIFKLIKFRSMKVDKLDVKGDISTARNDSRVTRVGRIIRATSIDELPQLLNVLLSEMSLVGPRPHALGSLAGKKLFWEVDGEYWQRHALKPGLTGLAQVRGHRGATDTEAHLTNRLQSDLEYIRDWSPWLDLKIMFATMKVLFPERA